MAGDWKIWQCLNCGFIYEEEFGLPDEGIAAGTRWDDVPDTWYCSQCGSGKLDFDMVGL